MKMKIKDGYVNIKSWAINYQVFMELAVKDKNFIPKLMEIRKRLRLPKLKIFAHTTVVLGENPTDKEWHAFSALNRKNVDCRNWFLEERQASDLQTMLFEPIDLILIDAGLGQEWKFPLIDFLLTGYITPPMGNLIIKPNAKTKTVSLEVNSNTALEDIRIFWPTIQKAIADVSGGIPQKRYLRPSFNEHLMQLSKAGIIQKKNPKIRGLDLIGRMTPELTDDNVMPSKEDEKKASANLKQIRHRFKSK